MTAKQGLPKDAEGSFDIPALDISYNDAILPQLNATDVQSAIDAIKTGSFSDEVKDTLFAIVDALDSTKKLKFDVAGTTGTKTTLQTSQTVDRILTLPDDDALVVVMQNGTGFVLLGSPTPLHASNSGIQYSSLVSNRAQIRENQYGANTGVPGISTFKSRGLTIGSLLPVAVGDVIFGVTAVGVTDNLSIPLSGLIQFVVPVGGVPAGQGWIATDYEIQNVPLAGPANGRRRCLRIDSEGIFWVRESVNSMAGVAVTGAGGTVVVANNRIAATSRITLTIQDGGAVPTAGVYISARVVNTSFTIQSLAAGDVGVNVYYQIWNPLTP